MLDEGTLQNWGVYLGHTLPVPTVIALRGDLGAGKTTLARAIARGAGVTGAIPSPTYNLLFRYPLADGRALVHIDLYRLEDEEEVWELGWAELPADNEIVLIEWPERAERLLPSPRWEIELSEGEDPEMRIVEVREVGGAGELPLPEAGG